MEMQKCCFCGKEMKDEMEWNNPAPLRDSPNSVCCSECENVYVIPCRRMLFRPWSGEDAYRKRLAQLRSLDLQEIKSSDNEKSIC